jgi:hypothetical protein
MLKCLFFINMLGIALYYYHEILFLIRGALRLELRWTTFPWKPQTCAKFPGYKAHTFLSHELQGACFLYSRGEKMPACCLLLMEPGLFLTQRPGFFPETHLRLSRSSVWRIGLALSQERSKEAGSWPRTGSRSAWSETQVSNWDSGCFAPNLWPG